MRLLAVSCWLELQRPLLHLVGTHESVEWEGVRCVKGYSIVILTGTDALPLDTSVRPSVQDSVMVRPSRTQSRLVSSHSAFLLTLSCYRADTVVCTSSKNNSSFGTF